MTFFAVLGVVPLNRFYDCLCGKRVLYAFLQQCSKPLFVFHYVLVKHGILFLHVPIRKVFEVPCLLFPEKSKKHFRWETESETKFTTRSEDATVYITADCSKHTFELELMCCCKVRMCPGNQVSNCFMIDTVHSEFTLLEKSV